VVAEDECAALGAGEQASGAAEVEGLAVAVEDGWHDLGVAGEASGFARADQRSLSRCLCKSI
jgi:hypothetical protein